MTDRPATRWSDVRLVAGREIGEKLRSKAFLLSTLFFLAIIAASIALPGLLADDGPPEYEVAAVGSRAGQLLEAVPDDRLDLTVRAVDEVAAADRLLRREAVDAAVEVRGEDLVLTGLHDVPDDLAEALGGTAQAAGLSAALERAGVAPGEAQDALAPPQVQERLLDDTGLDPADVPLLSVVFGMLFFFMVYQFGFAIAQGVVQEKESRIVELLVTAVPVRTLLFGKALGNGALALAQIVLLVAVAVTGAALTGEAELLRLLARNAGWFVLFFGLGFAMLSCLWAAAGAFASRSEDLQSTTTPLQVLVIVPFFASVYITDGPLRTALSFVPLSSPLMMPARLLEGDAEVWEAVLAAGLLLVAAVAAVLVGERLYRASLLRTRGKTSLADAWTGRAETAP